MSCAVDDDAIGNEFAYPGKDKLIAFPKMRQFPRTRTDETNPHYAAGWARKSPERQTRRSNCHDHSCCRILDKSAARGIRSTYLQWIRPDFSLVFHLHSPPKRIPRLSGALGR